jgi:hypothetical protein
MYKQDGRCTLISSFGVYKKQFLGMSKRGKAIQVTDVKYSEIFYSCPKCLLYLTINEHQILTSPCVSCKSDHVMSPR